MEKTGGVLVPLDEQNIALNNINIEEVYMSSLVNLDPFSCLMDRCYLIWTKANFLRALYKEQDQNAKDQENGSVLIIDACPRASRNESFKTCLEVSVAFMASMTKSISRYITVHLIFDQ